ncbi:efflux RND transporter periplasmic adaptor subunit [Phenylobacterium montanum]|uniref:efflux RND transporter periplasmic adaptor subunit n=1 Tax=Phenylobacterium montanum TaxID=2823693 RepID=UPI002012CD3D|nr:efflux RND transporter periplasmic adaptor subunit [Caulobacter sp. S6]
MRQLAVSAALVATLGLQGCNHSAAGDPRTQTQLVEIAQVESAEPGASGFTGLVVAHVESNLGFRVPGKVVERLVDSGQAVRRGQVLMRIDPADFEHNEAAQAGAVAAAKARVVQAAADEDRYRDLVSSGAVSRSAYDQAKQAADSARAMLSAAEAQLKVASDERAYSTLVADADGVVMETLVEPGQYVSAGQIVLRLAHAGPREAAVSLPETVRPAIGSQAQGSIYGVPSRASARLRQLSDSADPVTRTYEARYVLDGPAAQAPLGATATIYLNASRPDGEMAVPLGAIDDNGHTSGVWMLDAKGSAVSFRPVRVIRLEAERAIVSDGVRVGDRIVALGGHSLHDGELVRIAQGPVVK